MDGVGKSTTCKALADRLGYVFVEKPLHYLLDDSDNDFHQYQKIAKRVNENRSRDFTAWYYGLNNIYLYEKFKHQNIITDRHIVSNYCWSGTEYNDDIYNLILKKIGKPKLTVILYAKPETIEKRLLLRNQNDPDLMKVRLSEHVYERMIYFCEKKKLNYIIVKSDDKTTDQIVDEIVNVLKEDM